MAARSSRFARRPSRLAIARVHALWLAPQGDGDSLERALSTHSHDIEEGLALLPKFDADGLVTAVVTDAGNGDVLMVAHMNAEALAKTIETGEAWYFSRSRKKLWKKGETSGHVQRVRELRVDCDQDALWLKVDQEGEGACHTGRRSCFYRAAPLGQRGAVKLEFRDAERKFDPAAVYTPKG
ncbi:MAG: phosphoribosyl-AMP cyclohydrolase [Pseudolabrys sp.]|nr:phosphoribosyl-AMP cyclohydrolase [Pseudolabrys sp.]